MTLKVFTLGINGTSVPGPVLDLLGRRRTRNQVQVLVVAPSKASAFGLASAMPGVGVPAKSDPEFRVASGNDVDALAAAGQLDEPRVLAHHPDHGTDHVVEIRADGHHRIIGHLVRIPGYLFRFDPATGA